jgi:hypothetical protein
MTHPAGQSTYHCEGGRSFTVDLPTGGSAGQTAAVGGQGSFSATGGSGSLAPHPSTWYVAVSNCAALHGLDLRYRLVVYGHVGDCPPSMPPMSPAQQTASGLRTSQLVQNEGGLSGSSSDSEGGTGAGDDATAPDNSCRLQGEINSTSNWFGFIANASLARRGGFHYEFRFPMVAGTGVALDSIQATMPRVVRILLYSGDDVVKMSAEQTCWQRDGIIRQRNQPEQVGCMTSIVIACSLMITAAAVQIKCCPRMQMK